jgi:ABC-type uncharacterized transport system substrate-binding protein
MFTPKVYDLNIQTEARRKMQMEQVKKNIERSSHFPTIVEPSRRISVNPQMGTPAYAMSIKQRQQAMRYQAMNPEEEQM